MPIFGSGLTRPPRTTFLITTVGASTFTAPTWASSMDVAAWGGGGAGSGFNGGQTGGTGASRVAKTGVPITGGATLSLVIGAGGSGVGQNATVSAEATTVTLGSDVLTAAGAPLYPTYTGAASGGTGVFASPTITAGSAGTTGPINGLGQGPGFGGDAGDPDGGSGGRFIDDDSDGLPDTFVPASAPGGGGVTTFYFEPPVNTGGDAGAGAQGGVRFRFYP